MTIKTRQRDMIDVLTEDHREVEQMFTELGDTTDPRRRRELANVVIAELVRHAVAEEEYLYPTARTVLPDGDSIADREISEHAAAERTMKQLEDIDKTDAAFNPMLGSLMGQIRHHVRDEETKLFPRLRNACSHDDLRELGRKIELAKKAAPTRPHPATPDTPPWNKLLAPGAGLVDRVRDALTGRTTSPRDL